MYSLNNIVAVVTGGANGIGASIVRELLKEGAKYVAFIDIGEDAGKDLENELTKQHGEGSVKFFYCDVRKSELFDVFSTVTKDHGYIDLVVNNAGIADDTIENFMKTIEINFAATVRSSLKALEWMRVDHGGKGGTIVNVSSIMALSSDFGELPIYGGTKSAVLQFSCRIGRADMYERTNVRVLTVCFGATDTNLLQTCKSFDEKSNELIVDFQNNCETQTSDEAAQGVVQALKSGNCGSVWLINYAKVLEITDKIKKANAIMSQDVVV